MAEYPTRRRRLAALAVLVLACAALVATSPAIIQSSLDASHAGSAELTLEAPRVTGRVTLKLSAAALPAAGERGLRVSGSVGFSQRNQNAAVAGMSVRAVGVDAAPAVSDGSASWPIEQLCRVAESCQREFEVTFEWLDPQPGTIQRGTFDATLQIVYDRVENNPEGATASWSDSAAFTPAPAGPLVSAHTSPERLTLDRGHPIAVRHAMLTATNIPQSARTAAFIDSSAPDSGSPAVRFSVIPDNSGDGARAASDGAIDPFANCPETGECKRGVTVLIELAELEPDTAAAIEWSLKAHAEFPGASEPPDGARLSAVVDLSADVGPDTPVITAGASGTLEPGPDASGTVRSFTRALIAAEDATFRLGDSGAIPPLAVGILTIQAVDEATVDLNVSGSHGTIDAYPSVTLGPSRPSSTVLVYPFRWCDEDAACTAEIDLSANKTNPALADSLPVAAVEWTLDLTAFYPGLEEPPNGAQLRIDVHVDDR